MFTPPRLGPGAIYLRSLDSLFRSRGDLLKVAEIEPQVLWTKPTAAGAIPAGSPAERRYLSTLPQRVLTHGVGCPIGGTVCDQTAHVPEFQLWNRELNVPWTSEHLSILQLSGNSPDQTRSCGFLMPPVQSDAGVRLAAQNIIARRQALSLPFAFETGVNYFAPSATELPDGDFFAAVAEEADCGILLDLTNLWINQKNGRASIESVLARLPLERVWEIHLAGIEQDRGFWLDAHSREVDPELVSLTAGIIPHLPNLGAIIFELAPDRVATFAHSAYLGQIEMLNRLWEKSAPPVKPATRVPSPILGACLGPKTPIEWENHIAGQMLHTNPAAPDGSFDIYNYLAGSFRSGALVELLGNTMRLLQLALGKRGLESYVERYIAATQPAAFPTDEAIGFSRYLSAVSPLNIASLDDILRFETSVIEASANNTTVKVALSSAIDAMLDDIAAGRLPCASAGECMLLEIGVDPVPFVRPAASGSGGGVRLTA